MTIKERKARAKKAKRFMKNNRIKDDKHLRDVLNNKLVWVTNERVKGLKLIEETRVKVFKLEGMILLINDILNPKKEEK